MHLNQPIRVKIKHNYRAAVGGLPHNQEYITGRVSYIGQYFFNIRVAAGYQESILRVDLLIGAVKIVG